MLEKVIIFSLMMMVCGSVYAENSGKKSINIEDYYINPRDVELKMTFTLSGIKKADSDMVTMYEFSEEPVSWPAEKKSEKPILLLYAVRQQEYKNQRDFEYISIDPKTDEIVSGDLDGNIIEYWDLTDEINKGVEEIVITRHFKFKAYETAFQIDPDLVGEYDTNDPLYKYYTRTQELIELTPSVRKLANKIVGDETNPYLKARAIYNWCVDNISYLYPKNRGIRFCLPRGTGDCGSYSLIFVALCRSVGIPARVANGHWCCKAKKNYHVWNEFYLPNYGWIPADSTDGRITREKPSLLAGDGDSEYYFGNLDSGRFISSKGTSIQLYPSPPWDIWGLADTNRNPMFFQTATTVYSGITIESQDMSIEIIKGNDILW